MNMKELIKRLLREEFEYKGEHTAPDKDAIPIYDMTIGYPDDIYSIDAARLYGDHNDEYSDQYSLSVINSVRNKPKTKVKIYRAVPDINYDITNKIKELNRIITYYNTYKFFPLKNNIIYSLSDKYPVDTHGYDKSQELILKDLENQIIELNKLKEKKLTINNGDWVTINPEYAKSHGRDNLNNKFRVISKIVPASTLFTFGDSIHEWGYNI